MTDPASTSELNEKIAKLRGWTVVRRPDGDHAIMGWSPPGKKSWGQLPDFTKPEHVWMLLEELFDRGYYVEGSREGDTRFILLQGGNGAFPLPFKGPALAVAVCNAWVAAAEEAKL